MPGLFRTGRRQSGDIARGRHQATTTARHCNGASSGGRTTKSDERRKSEMALTKEFKETVKARADRDPAFRQALLTEAAEQLLSGDLETGKAVLRDYINATIGFEALAKATGTPPKTLMRMLGPRGNPRASNLLAVLGKLQRVSRVHLAVTAG